MSAARWRLLHAGTIQQWQQNIAAPAVGNDLLMFSISAAFAAPLLDIVNAPAGGFHLHGPSQTGKTTLLQSAASVWGPGDPSKANSQLRSWRATQRTGWKGDEPERRDGFLPLDEINQANPYEIVAIVYMLGNAQGKTRANRDGAVRLPVTMRSLVLSSGRDHDRHQGGQIRRHLPAGAEARLLDLSADAEAGYGVWQVIGNHASGAALTDHLKASSHYCGTAGPAFLEKLVEAASEGPGQAPGNVAGVDRAVRHRRHRRRRLRSGAKRRRPLRSGSRGG